MEYVLFSIVAGFFIMNFMFAVGAVVAAIEFGDGWWFNFKGLWLSVFTLDSAKMFLSYFVILFGGIFLLGVALYFSALFVDFVMPLIG